MVHIAYIGIGSNLGDRQRHCERAIELLSQRSDLTLLRVSPWYESEATTVEGEPSDDPRYLNGAAALQTALSPEQLLSVLLDIEAVLGRPHHRTKGTPRTIDLDLLLVGNEQRATATLTLPHPRLSKRTFVLQPLCDIAPHALDPESGLSIRALLERCASTVTCRRLAAAEDTGKG
jgi:2-amino-4-hydroxy-6-hydroxymethyldihydropteridine diphosphokinase